MCAFFQLWSFENYTSKFRPHLRHKILCSFSPSPFTHLLFPSSSYPWLPMEVSLFLTHLLIEVASAITFPPFSFCCHWSSRSKGLHWWRRFKAYKFHMELRHVVSRASSSRWCSFASWRPMEAKWRRRKGDWRCHFKEKMSQEQAHHHKKPWIRAWR